MTQLPEGVFSIFSAGYKQTALDRLSNDDNSPNSVFTRTFAKELLLPGENLVEVAQHTRKLVSEMADSIGHRQIPAYTDQMVDNVFLNGLAKAQADAVRPAEPVQKVAAAIPPVVAPRNPNPQAESLNAPIAAFSRHNGGWSVVFSIADPTLGISWRMGESGDFRETGFLDTLDPRTRKRMPNPSIELAADAPAATIQVRYIDASGEMQGPFPIKFDPEAALLRDQRKILDMTAGSWLSFREFNGLLVYYTHLVSYRCAIREVRIGIDNAVPSKVLKMPPCDMRDPNADSLRRTALHEAAADHPIHVGRIDLSRRQRVGDQELPHRQSQQQLSFAGIRRSASTHDRKPAIDGDGRAGDEVGGARGQKHRNASKISDLRPIARPACAPAPARAVRRPRRGRAWSDRCRSSPAGSHWPGCCRPPRRRHRRA